MKTWKQYWVVVEQSLSINMMDRRCHCIDTQKRFDVKSMDTDKSVIWETSVWMREKMETVIITVFMKTVMINVLMLHRIHMDVSGNTNFVCSVQYCPHGSNVYTCTKYFDVEIFCTNVRSRCSVWTLRKVFHQGMDTLENMIWKSSMSIAQNI